MGLLGVGAAAFGRVRLGEFLALVASVGARVQLTRAHIVVEGLDEVAQLTPFAATTSLGVEWVL
jgi:hypothetical protein